MDEHSFEFLTFAVRNLYEFGFGEVICLPGLCYVFIIFYRSFNFPLYTFYFTQRVLVGVVKDWKPTTALFPSFANRALYRPSPSVIRTGTPFLRLTP